MILTDNLNHFRLEDPHTQWTAPASPRDTPTPPSSRSSPLSDKGDSIADQHYEKGIGYYLSPTTAGLSSDQERILSKTGFGKRSYSAIRPKDGEGRLYFTYLLANKELPPETAQIPTRRIKHLIHCIAAQYSLGAKHRQIEQKIISAFAKSLSSQSPNSNTDSLKSIRAKMAKGEQRIISLFKRDGVTGVNGYSLSMILDDISFHSGFLD